MATGRALGCTGAACTARAAVASSRWRTLARPPGRCWHTRVPQRAARLRPDARPCSYGDLGSFLSDGLKISAGDGRAVATRFQRTARFNPLRNADTPSPYAPNAAELRNPIIGITAASDRTTAAPPSADINCRLPMLIAIQPLANGIMTRSNVGNGIMPQSAGLRPTSRWFYGQSSLFFSGAAIRSLLD
jgi:hypothetical protein